MYNSAPHDLHVDLAGAEDLVRARLSREFPRVPNRVIASVLAAYRRITPTLQDAFAAARVRLRDACAT